VADYRIIDPDLGSMQQFVALAADLRDRGMSLCIDVVVNHVAREHEWAQKAMAGDPVYLDYFFTFTDRALPDQYERTLREVFPDLAPGSFTWVPDMAGSGRWVWTTFNDFQWDLNYHNPAVFREMADIMLFLANQGADVLRLDAIPFIWKHMSTDCENQPETHLLVQAFRAVVRIVAPGAIFKAEAIVALDKLVPYLGVGQAAGKECELAYHNQLMVLLWSALASRHVNLLTHSLHQMPPTPSGATWLTYIRNHDDIGWAITDTNASAVGENAFLHRQFLNAFYSGSFSGSFAQGALFQYNPITQDARISGSTASLAGLEQALALGSPYEIDRAIRRILLLHSVIMTFGGIPLIYMGDEVGMLNDWQFNNDPLKAADNRWMHRPRMDWQQAAERYDMQSPAGRIYAGLRQLIRLRAENPAVHGAASMQPYWTDNPHVFALVRQYPGGNLLLLANFHESWQHVGAELLSYANMHGTLYNLLDPTGQRGLVRDGRIYLEPYESMWIVERNLER
jgi:amylosucrase